MKKIFVLMVAAILAVSVSAQQSDSLAVADVQGEVAATDGSSVSETDDPEEIWKQANEAYLNSDYAGAARLYESILDRGLFSMKLYYNLANACFKTGQTGKAILFYRRALALSPSNDDIRHNLAIAESYTKDRIENVPEFFVKTWVRTVRNTLSCRAWTVVSLVFLALVLVLGLVYLLSQRLSARKAGFYGMLVSIVLFVVTTWFAAAERRVMLDRAEAVVMSSAAPVKSSPDNAATDLFVIHEGTTVRVVGTLESWSEIVIADGKKGWIESSKIERI